MGNANNKLNKFPQISIEYPFITNFVFNNYIKVNRMNNILIYKPKTKITLSKTSNLTLKIKSNDINEFRFIDMNEVNFNENTIKKGKIMMDSNNVCIGKYTLKFRMDFNNNLDSLILNYSI